MDKTKENIEEEAENLINEETETTAEENVSEAEDTTPQEEETENEEATEEKDPLEAANEEIEQLKDKFLRTVAEFENYKKRTLKEKTELILNGAEKTVDAFLPVVDDFERALTTAEKADDVAALKEGMELIYKKFMKTLEGLGVKKIETEDADFDVDYHEAVAMVPAADDDKKGKVIDCIQTGYTLNDKVIRHAKVAVGQ
ncbi:MAG: nucleotide exchange factor GrpE [Prevotella sp.]|jgi:molecular chaperone GrpE|nr:nucleotide exchange factor GrpE [Prevotella sp.]